MASSVILEKLDNWRKFAQSGTYVMILNIFGKKLVFLLKTKLNYAKIGS
jgi:hypothetical protein